MNAQPTDCPVCGAALPQGARFCPACGNAVGEGETVRAEVPPHETTAAPVVVERVAPRWFGVTPPSLLLALTAIAALVAAALLVLGSWIAGLLVLGLALLFAAAFIEAGRRKPDAEVVRASVEAVDSFRARAGFAAQTWATRSTARRETVRRRAELFRLASERSRLLGELGAAVYAGDDPEPLRARVAAIDERAAALEREIAEIVAHAQSQVRDAKLRVQPTEVVRPPNSE